MLDSLDNPACRDVCGKFWKGLRFQLREARYTHCVILAGTNDVGGCKGSAENIFKNIEKLANVAKDHGCETFVMTIPELRYERHDASMCAIRTHINHLLMQSQSLNTIDLSLVVPYHCLLSAERDIIWEPDGLHLRPAGYDKIGKAVAARIQLARVAKGASTASTRVADGEEEARTLGALSILCIIVRMPGLVALIRCLAISTKSLHAAWEVLRQDRLGPALQFVTGGELGVGVGWAVPLDVFVSVALPVAARARAWHLRAAPVQGGGTAGSGWIERLWCMCCALGILLVQEDVYVMMWVTLLFLALSGSGGTRVQKVKKSQ
jgi:hypothetical protein